jgi:hypothetical protein
MANRFDHPTTPKSATATACVKLLVDARWREPIREESAMNIGEIARRAGVSRSTVSYALSGKRTVSEETKRRIQAVIDELDYRPNSPRPACA